MITKNWCLVATTHEIPSHNIPTFFFSSLRLSQHIAWYASSLPTCKRIYPGLIEEFSTLTEEREWYNWIPRCPMGSLPFSYSLSQSFSRQLAATKHGVHPDQGNPRSGACVCAYCLVFPGPPPLKKIHTAQQTRNGDLDLGSWCIGSHLSVCPVCLYCL